MRMMLTLMLITLATATTGAKNEFTTSFGDDRNFDKLFTEPANFDNKTGANFRVTI